MLRFLLIALLSVTAVAPRDLAAQGAVTRTGGSVPTVLVSAKVGAKSYEGTGPGSCRHTADAAIYDVPAALWMVEQSGSSNGDIKNLNLTIWRPKDGSRDQISLALTTSSASHRIDVGGRGDQVGSGKATVTPKGAGGRVEIQGKDESGAAVQVVITCPAFSGVQAEGG